MHPIQSTRPAARVCLTLAVSLALLLPPGSSAAGQEASVKIPAELEPVRTALDKYRDPILAVHDGFLSTLGCVEYPEGGKEGFMQYEPGGMGVHFINLQNIQPQLDPEKPQVLIYEPHGEELRLVAAEWFLPVEVAGAEPPTIFGHALQGPMEGHRPLMPEGFHHYDLHVWLWKANPAGVFSPTNPDVKCPAHAYSFEEEAPRLVHGQHR